MWRTRSLSSSVRSSPLVAPLLGIGRQLPICRFSWFPDLSAPPPSAHDDRGLSFVIRSVCGVVLGTATGVWLWPSSADSYSHTDLVVRDDQGVLPRKETKYIFGGRHRWKVFGTVPASALYLHWVRVVPPSGWEYSWFQQQNPEVLFRCLSTRDFRWGWSSILGPCVFTVGKPRDLFIVVLFPEAYKRRVFFNYEKRMRMRSPPEKVFEYFASHRNAEGELLMTPADLMRAVVPVFPPSESHVVRDGFLRGERPPGELHCADSTFFMLFDTNNDGLISFAEYIFFVTLLSIPESSFAVAFKMFDPDNNGEIDKEEFKKVMSLMRSYNRQGAKHRDGLRTGFKTGESVENGGLVEYFFGKEGQSALQHEKFVGFLRDLYDEIIRLEFTHYDYKLRGSISGKDFALSMVAAADMAHINKFLDRVDEIDNDPHLSGIRVKLEEFKSFAELRRRIHPLALAMFSYGKLNGLLTKKDFQRAASQVCGVSVTDDMTDLIFYIFDVNRDGKLSVKEFLAVLERREDIAYPTGVGFMGMISCWLNCAKSCSLPCLLRDSDTGSR